MLSLRVKTVQLPSYFSVWWILLGTPDGAMILTLIHVAVGIYAFQNFEQGKQKWLEVE
jgi:hypothetical protein